MRLKEEERSMYLQICGVYIFVMQIQVKWTNKAEYER